MFNANQRTEKVSLETFLAIDVYPANRVVGNRLKKAHLTGKLTSPKQLEVAVVEFPHGTLMKIDGHSRAAAWIQGTLERPSHVLMTIYPVQTMDEVHALHDVFVSSANAATAMEATQTAQARSGFTLQSKMCSQSWKAPFKLANCKTLEEGYKTHATTLAWLDSFNINKLTPEIKKMFSVGVRAAILTTVQQYSHVAKDFWIDFMRDTCTIPEVVLYKHGVINTIGSNGQTSVTLYVRGVDAVERYIARITVGTK